MPHPPANPYSFVRKHHAPESNSAVGGVGVVPHPPQILVPSSGSTTPLSQTAPPAGSAWCLIPRKSLFLRLEAPRPKPKWRRRRGRRGASHPANPCSFIRKHHANPYSFVRRHHAPESNSAAGGVGVVPHPPQILVPSSRGTTPSAQTAPQPVPAAGLPQTQAAQFVEMK